MRREDQHRHDRSNIPAPGVGEEDGDSEHDEGDSQPEVDDGPDGEGGAWRGKVRNPHN